MKDLDTKLRFVELRAKGWSYARIAKTLEVSKPTLIEWSKTLRVELHNAKALRWQELEESLQVSAEARLTRLAKQAKRICKELNDRFLDEVPTETLLELLLKLNRELKAELPSNTFTSRELADLNLRDCRKEWDG